MWAPVQMACVTRSLATPPMRFNRHVAILCLPGFALILGAYLLLGRPPALVIVAASAYSVAFGVAKRIGSRRWAAMAATGCGMTFVAFAGTLAGRDPDADVIGAATLAACAGGLSRYGGDRSWAWLQFMIAFLLAAQFPGGVSKAVHRATLVAAGAGFQFLVTRVMVVALGDIPAPDVVGNAPVTPRLVASHALRTAACVGAALLATRALGLAHGYWTPITAMAVLKPGVRDTWSRGVERLAATLFGIVVASLGIALVGDRHVPVALLTLGAAAASFGLQTARYFIFSTAITMCVMLLLALGGLSGIATDAQRLLATLLGGLFAIAVSLIAPCRRRS